MCPFERYTKTLKDYFRSCNYPEGCIAESYIAEEELEFYAEYMSNIDTAKVPLGHAHIVWWESGTNSSTFTRSSAPVHLA